MFETEYACVASGDGILPESTAVSPKKPDLRITYSGGMNSALDSGIEALAKSHGYKWYAQGVNTKTGERDICFDEADGVPMDDGAPVDTNTRKTLCNTDIDGAEKNVPDIVKFGNGDMFQLLCKASSKKEDWMKSTKAMEIPGIGCVVQVTTQQGNNVAEAVVFVPGTKIVGDGENGRSLVRDSQIS